MTMLVFFVKAGSSGSRGNFIDRITTVRLKVEQIQLVSGVEQVGLGRVGLQGA